VSWAAKAAARSGADVVPLLQATDPALFRPEAAEPDTGDPVLFVGNSRKVFRPVVRDLLAAGVDVAVYGSQWEPFLSPLGRSVQAQFVPNDQLPAAYRAAGVVLNDHWDDMRTEGFVSNRLFDAAAAGARVVSDHIDGVEDLFGGLVRTYRTAQELVALVRQAPDGYPAEPQRSQIARRVGREHSFDARAATLLEDALKLRAG
jgi:spore maturation protein CgeB